jgi:hypothetical protein
MRWQPKSRAALYAKTTRFARFPGICRQGLDRPAFCITILKSIRKGPAMIAIAKELGVSLD